MVYTRGGSWFRTSCFREGKPRTSRFPRDGFRQVQSPFWSEACLRFRQLVDVSTDVFSSPLLLALPAVADPYLSCVFSGNWFDQALQEGQTPRDPIASTAIFTPMETSRPNGNLYGAQFAAAPHGSPAPEEGKVARDSLRRSNPSLLTVTWSCILQLALTP